MHSLTEKIRHARSKWVFGKKPNLTDAINETVIEEMERIYVEIAGTTDGLSHILPLSKECLKEILGLPKYRSLEDEFIESLQGDKLPSAKGLDDIVASLTSRAFAFARKNKERL